MHRLPDIPSKLLRVALADFIACETDSRYEFDMGVWHSAAASTQEKCRVCLAGAVMAKSLNTNRNKYYLPENFDSDTAKKLDAIDAIRTGNIFGFFLNMRIPRPPSLPSERSGLYDLLPSTGDYINDRDAFLSWIEGFIGILEAEGL